MIKGKYENTKNDHTAEAVGKLTPDYEISCSLLEPLITGKNPYKTRNQFLKIVIKH